MTCFLGSAKYCRGVSLENKRWRDRLLGAHYGSLSELTSTTDHVSFGSNADDLFLFS